MLDVGSKPVERPVPAPAFLRTAKAPREADDLTAGGVPIDRASQAPLGADGQNAVRLRVCRCTDLKDREQCDTHNPTVERHASTESNCCARTTSSVRRYDGPPIREAANRRRHSGTLRG